jgi:uncharacterized protein YndB with AHSA1/START domain
MKNENQLIISRVFNAPIEKVWQAWTDPQMIMQWWGPEGFTSPSAKVDLRIGGKAIFAMHGPAGSEWDKNMYSAGVYKEIVPPSADSKQAKIVTTDYFSDENGEVMSPAEQGQDANFPTEMTVTILFEDVSENPPSPTASEGQRKTKLSIIYDKTENEEQWQAMVASGMKEGWESSLNKLEKALN